MAAYNLGKAHGKIEIDTSDLTRAGAAFNTFGNAFIAVGAAALAGFGYAVKAAADFEKSLSGFKAVSGSTEQQMEAVRQKALQLGRDTKFSAGEVATAFSELAKSGVSAEQIIKGVGDATVALAAATDIPIAVAAEKVVDIMHTFNLQAEDAVHIVNRLAGTANASTVDVQDLAYSMKYAGSVAAQLGHSVDDTTTALGILGQAGIRGSTAGTSLRRILLNLTPASEKAYDMMKELGIITKDGANQFYTATGRAKSMAEIMEVLKRSTAGLSDQQKVQAMNTIFGNRAVSSAIILANQGAAGYNRMNAEIGKVTAAEVAAERMNNLAGRLEILKGSLETAFIAAGAPAQKPLMQLADALTTVVNKFSELSPETQANITKFLLIAGAVFLTLGVFAKFVFFIFRIIAAFQQLAAAIKFIAASFKILTMTMLANPIILIIAAIVALGVALYALYRNSEGFRKFVDDMWQSFQAGWDKILGFFKGIPKWFEDRWTAIRNAFRAGVTGVTTAWSTMVRAVVGAGATVINFLRALPGNVVRFLFELGTRIVSELIGLGPKAAYAMGYVLGLIIRLLINLPSTIGKVMTGMVEFFVEIFAKMMTGAWNFLSEWMPKILDFFISLPGKVWEAVSQLLPMLAQVWWDVMMAGWNLVREWMPKILNFFLQLPARVWNALATLGSKLWTVFDSAGRGMWDALWRHGRTIVDFFIGLPDRLWNAIKGLAGQIWNWFSDIGSSLWNGFWDAVSGSPRTKIEYTMLDIEDQMRATHANLARELPRLQKLVDQYMPKPSITLAAAGSTASGVIPAGAQAALGATASPPPASTPTADSHDTIIINPTRFQDAADISREIMWKKRVRV